MCIFCAQNLEVAILHLVFKLLSDRSTGTLILNKDLLKELCWCVTQPDSHALRQCVRVALWYVYKLPVTLAALVVLVKYFTVFQTAFTGPCSVRSTLTDAYCRCDMYAPKRL